MSEQPAETLSCLTAMAHGLVVVNPQMVTSRPFVAGRASPGPEQRGLAVQAWKKVRGDDGSRIITPGAKGW